MCGIIVGSFHFQVMQQLCLIGCVHTAIDVGQGQGDKDILQVCTNFGTEEKGLEELPYYGPCKCCGFNDQ